MPKQVFLAHFQLVVARFGPPKIPNCLENGLFWDKEGVKNGSKMFFSKNDPRSFGVHKQVKGALFEPIASHFGHSEVTKCLENGLFWYQKPVKHGSKMCTARNSFGLLGVHKELE